VLLEMKLFPCVMVAICITLDADVGISIYFF
jgi:hypothetical protein